MLVHSLESVQAITLDAGGTLVHPHPSVGTVYAEILSGHGIEADPGRLEVSFREAFEAADSDRKDEVNDRIELEFWRRVVRQTLDGHCSGDHFEEVFDELYREYGSSRRWRLTEDAIPTIKELRTRGYQVAVLSNWDSRLRQVLNELELDLLLDACFISCEIGFEKPDRRIFRHVEEALALKPPQILHVGDSPVHDAEGARQSGWNYMVLHENRNTSPNDEHLISRLGDILLKLPPIVRFSTEL